MLTYGKSFVQSLNDRMTRQAAVQPAEDLGAREKILREATHLFAVHGFEGTSLRMIAEAVGLQKGSLVYHFDTKEKIRGEVLDAIIARWQDIVPQIILTASTGENRFDRTIAECTRFFSEDPNRARVLLRECLDHPDEMQRRVTTQLAPWLGLLADRIRQGQKEGIIHPEADPVVYVWSVVLLTITTLAVSGMSAGIIGPKKTHERIQSEIIRIARTSLFLERQEA
jgi:AcrR family transcriptional regulator